MNKIVVYENSYADIDDMNMDMFNDLLDIGYQIKEELGLMYSPVQSVSAKKIYIGNIVGNVTLNSTNLIIYPKYVSSNGGNVNDVLIKKLFTRTIRCSMGNLGSTVFFYRNNIINDQNDFFDTLAKYYLDATLQATKKSKICLYEERIEKVNTIKGRILVQKQLSGPVLDEKTWCKYRRLSDNNIYNQLLGWCCKFLSGLSSNIDVKRKLLNLYREFPQQMDLLNIHSVSRIKVPRQFNEYDESVLLAKNLYLDYSSKKEKIHEGNRVCGYAINMERSFENIVCYYSRIAASNCACSHKSQAARLLAYASALGSDLSYEVRPDDLITKGTRNLVMDAKYKIISAADKYKKKPSREDFYQMISSCLAYDCHEAVLVYPHTSVFPQLSWETTQKINGFNIIVRAESISLDVGDEELINQLSDIIKKTTFFKEVANG